MPTSSRSRIARVSLLLGLSTVGTSASALIRNKLLAWLVGPEGVGVYGQLAGLQSVATIAASLGLTAALVRVLAAHREAGWSAQDAQQIGQVGAFQLSIAIVVAIAANLGAATVARYSLGSSSLEWAVRIASIGLPATVCAQLFQNVALAGGHVRRYVGAMLCEAAVTTALAAVLVVRLGLVGAIAYLAAGPCVSLAVASIAYEPVVPRGTFREIFARIVAPRPQAVLSLVTFGVTIALGYFCRQGTVTTVRSIIIDTLGARNAGLFQCAYALSTYYLLFFTQPMLNVAYPGFSALGDFDDSHAEYLRWLDVVISVVPLLLLAYVASLPVIVPLLNSGHFVAAIPIAAWQAAGDFCFLVLWLNRIHLFAHNRIWRALALELALDACAILGSLFALRRFGVLGAPLAYAGSAALVMTVSFASYGREGFRLWLRVLPPVVALGFSGVTGGFAGWHQPAAAAGALVLLGLATLPHHKQLSAFLRQVLRR